VRTGDLQEHLLRYRPTIVHFSGHGSPAGQIVLEDPGGRAKPVAAQALGQLFNALKDDNPADDIRCVVLNACFSAAQAQSIADAVGCVVGMTRAASDEAAMAFSGALYRALGYCKSVQQAFNLACAEMGFLGEPETPRLLTANVDAARLKFC
jgi:hypothetical protein